MISDKNGQKRLKLSSVFELRSSVIRERIQSGILLSKVKLQENALSKLIEEKSKLSQEKKETYQSNLEREINDYSKVLDKLFLIEKENSDLKSRQKLLESNVFKLNKQLSNNKTKTQKEINSLRTTLEKLTIERDEFKEKNEEILDEKRYLESLNEYNKHEIKKLINSEKKINLEFIGTKNVTTESRQIKQEKEGFGMDLKGLKDLTRKDEGIKPPLNYNQTKQAESNKKNEFKNELKALKKKISLAEKQKSFMEEKTNRMTSRMAELEWFEKEYRNLFPEFDSLLELFEKFDFLKKKICIKKSKEKKLKAKMENIKEEKSVLNDRIKQIEQENFLLKKKTTQDKDNKVVLNEKINHLEMSFCNYRKIIKSYEAELNCRRKGSLGEMEMQKAEEKIMSERVQFLEEELRDAQNRISRMIELHKKYFGIRGKVEELENRLEFEGKTAIEDREELEEIKTAIEEAEKLFLPELVKRENLETKKGDEMMETIAKEIESEFESDGGSGEEFKSDYGNEEDVIVID